jgi:hypothetical protein
VFPGVDGEFRAGGVTHLVGCREQHGVTDIARLDPLNWVGVDEERAELRRTISVSSSPSPATISVSTPVGCTVFTRMWCLANSLASDLAMPCVAAT